MKKTLCLSNNVTKKVKNLLLLCARVMPCPSLLPLQCLFVDAEDVHIFIKQRWEKSNKGKPNCSLFPGVYFPGVFV